MQMDIFTIITKLNCLYFPGKEHNFKKISEVYVDPLDAAYDTSSIMHYGKYAFNKNGRPTIVVIGQPLSPIGQRNGFSKTDIEQLNALYDCSNPGMSFVHSIALQMENECMCPNFLI